MFLQATHAFRLGAGLNNRTPALSRFLSTAVRKRGSALKASTASTNFDHIVEPLLPEFTSQSSTIPIRTRTPVTIITSREQARNAVRILEANPDAVWACDTEVADIDVKEQGPVGNGKVICASIFGGDNIDFGTGSTLWIENMGEADGVLQEFKAWFENPKYKKAWHNYGFDRHVMDNEGIACKGFAGDTMHMARLWDTSRDKATGGGDGYSLASLTEVFYAEDSRFIKTSMKDIFGVSKLKKDGTPSKIKEIPDLRVLQQSEEFRSDWIEYSARDAVATWWVRHELEVQLKKMPWIVGGKRLGNLYDFYQMYLKDFGELLTDMESNGIRVDTENHLRLAEVRAREERSTMEKLFMDWAIEQCPEAVYMNIASTTQMQQLLFGHYEAGQLVSSERSFKIDKSEEEVKSEKENAVKENPYALLNATELREICKERGIKSSGSKGELVESLQNFDTQVLETLKMDEEDLMQRCIARGLEIDGLDRMNIASKFVASEWAATKKMAKRKAEANPAPEPPVVSTNVAPPTAQGVKKYREITIKSIGMTPTDFTSTGQPQVSAAVLKKLAGKNLFGEEKEAVWGTALKFFKDPEEGKKACRAIGALAAVGQVDTTINTFLVPLQALVDKNSRIHCSLNLNTETGRLSSRRPNLQNQPALEKDQYKIRDAFVAEEGKTFIVADYGQLELRVLAHIARCQSMIDAFSKGGCFHSRTAVGMYDYIKQAVDDGKVMLEWDYSKGQPTVPLVKDTYASERRKAKTLNFSIAYGKTVHGLAQDWGITKGEAEETLQAWYRDRPEVKEWQEQTQYLAKKAGYVRTIMGRYRRLPDAKLAGPLTSHALRAAINTPIQGSAADIVMMAMIKLWKSKVLEGLGWKLLLQIHDEVILEGPKESRDEAMKEVRHCMENPFDDFGLSKLLVHLDVDAKSADSWYKAK